MPPVDHKLLSSTGTHYYHAPEYNTLVAAGYSTVSIESFHHYNLSPHLQNEQHSGRTHSRWRQSRHLSQRRRTVILPTLVGVFLPSRDHVRHHHCRGQERRRCRENMLLLHGTGNDSNVARAVRRLWSASKPKRQCR